MNKIWTGLLAGWVFFSAVFLPISANASVAACSADSLALIQKLYIAFHGRPADPDGLNYWACQLDSVGGGMSSIVHAFGASSEFRVRFGALNHDQFLEDMYRQILAREPDSSGKEFYLAMLNNGDMTLQEITIDILNGINGGVDAETFSNKEMVANYFTDQLEASNFSYSNTEEVRLVLSGVDGATASVNQAILAYNSLLAGLAPAVQSPPSIAVPNIDDDGNYIVSWTGSPTPGVMYLLEESGTSNFTPGSFWRPCQGTNLDCHISNNLPGATYYYRVKAIKTGYPESAWVTAENGCAVATPPENSETVMYAGREWQKSGSSQAMNWAAANTYCARATTGGHDDWYLPSIETLRSLISCSNGSQVTFGRDNKTGRSYCGDRNLAGYTRPAMPPILTRITDFAGFAYDFWSSTTYAYDPSHAWYVYFYDGDVYNYGKSNNFHVRCVRGGQ